MRGGWLTRGRAHVLGHDVPHDGGIMPVSIVAARITEPAELIPHLFRDIDPGLAGRLQPGDFIVAGRNFGAGKPHTSGYLAMASLGLRVLCETAPSAVVRATLNFGLPCMYRCAGITSLVADGDEIEVDCAAGRVENLTRPALREFEPISGDARRMLERGGLNGLLRSWLAAHPELGTPYPASGDEQGPVP